MAFQERAFSRIFVLSILFLASLPWAKPSKASHDTAKAVGRLIVDGVEKPVYFEQKDGAPRKYFLDAGGKQVDLSVYQRKAAQEKRQRYGTFGKRLFDTLSTLRSEQEVDVHLSFARSAIKGSRKDGKLTKAEAEAQTEASFRQGIQALKSRLGARAARDTIFRGKNDLRLRLRKSELLDLKSAPGIQSIELPLVPHRQKVLREAALEESFMGAGWNSGGFRFPSDCGSEYGCGAGTTIGVLERNPIWDSDSADHLDGGWFIKRPGTPVEPRHPHGLWTSAILRNSGPGHTGSAFNGGGAYNASAISLSYPVSPDSTMQDAYDWLMGQNVGIVNHSWRFPRYLGGAHAAEANEFERQLDIVSVGYPYVLNVEAAGNSGDTADGGENDACVDSSAVYDSPGWTAEACQRVGWWNHNGLIVGAVDDDSSRSGFSAFGNGPENNEAPHVVVRGAGIELPWMSPFDSSKTCPSDTGTANAAGPLCGTSFAAPTVAALAAHLSSAGSLTYYPETIKNIIMASATPRPIGRSRWPRYAYDPYYYQDHKTGTGIPDQATADSILRNPHYGSNFSPGVYGFKNFFVNSNETSYDEWDTITVSHPEGGVIHFYMTWMGSPANVTPGTRYQPDDLDLYVSVDGQAQYYSTSWNNTTEYVSYPINPGVSTTIFVRRYLYNRVLDENVPIYGSLVWTYTPPPVVQIHAPLDSSFTNQNFLQLDWSIDGVPDSTWNTDYLYTEGPTVITRCYDGYYFCDSVTVFLDQTAPVVQITDPGDDTTVAAEPYLVHFLVDGQPRTRSVPLNPGPNLVVIDTLDAAGNRGADTVEITYAVPVGTPVWPSWSHLSVSDVHPSSLRISWTPAVDDSGVSGYRIYRDSVLIDSVPGNQVTYMDVGLYWNHAFLYKVEAGDLRDNWSTNGPDSVFSTSGELPPDPVTIAPPIDNTVATTLFSAASFLFSGSPPIQTGMVPHSIDTLRAAVVRGVVTDAAGAPLPGASVSILGEKAFGSTVTRSDGGYDMMINGGGPATLKIVKPGYLQVQRRQTIPWRDYAVFPQVVMLPSDSVSQVVALDSSTPMQVFRASVVSDTDGTRQVTMLIPENTTAVQVFPDGSTRPLPSITVRATEFTVGPNGPKAMPAELPKTSSYTYAVDLSADEVRHEGSSVRFSNPIFTYVEDFVGIPVGWPVPSASYDRAKGIWIPEVDGRVIKIHSVSGGKANVVLDGTGTPADSSHLAQLGFTNAEREKLAATYSVGDSLWRMPVSHFSIWDFNYALRYGAGGNDPGGGVPGQGGGGGGDPAKNNKECGSVIGCESQTLGESFPLAGTPFSMHYSSDRVKGRRAEFFKEIRLLDSVWDSRIEDVLLEIQIAGRSWQYHFEPAPNLKFDFEWDGRDAYGRIVQGKQTLTYSIGLGIDFGYVRPPAGWKTFGVNETNTGEIVAKARNLTYEGRRFQVDLGTTASLRQGIGGWSLDVQPYYDVAGKVLHYGNGDRKKAEDFEIPWVAKTVAGNGEVDDTGDNGPAVDAAITSASAIDIAPDGSIFIAATGNLRVRKVDPNGIITTVAGTGNFDYTGDGGLAINADVIPYDVKVMGDGGFIILDIDYSVIRRVDPQGIISTVKFREESADSIGDTSLPDSIINGLVAMATSPDGSIYAASYSENIIRKIGPDGTIHTIAGNGNGTYSGDGLQAIDASFHPHSLDVDREGNLYVADYTNFRLYKISQDGFFTTIAGTGSGSATGDGDSAKYAGIQPYKIKVANERNGKAFYLANRGGKQSIRKIDVQGIITTIAGGLDSNERTKENRPPTSEWIKDVSGIAVGPDGSVFYTQHTRGKVRKIQPSLPEFSNSGFFVASEDGKEIYSFDAFGKCLRTLNSLTGNPNYTFEYDGMGLLWKIKDASGNETSIQRDVDGNIESILSPYGQETLFELNDSGYISKVTNPAGEVRQYQYSAKGLLTHYLTPRGFDHEFTYDSLGRLSRDDDPAGGFKTLTRTDTKNGIFSTLTTALGRVKTYLVEKLASGAARRVVTQPSGASTQTVSFSDGLVTTKNPDSSKVEVRQGPDPRFGFQSPTPESTVVSMPSGLKSITTHKSGAVLSIPGNPLTLQSLSDTIIVNGKAFKTTFETSTGTRTSVTPEGRIRKMTIDSAGRIVKTRVDGLDSVIYSHDERGRPDSTSQGAGPSKRTQSLEYDEQGYLSKLTDASGRVFGYEYDPAGRKTKVILPDSSEILFAYDSAGNVSSISPPGKPSHDFSYTSTDRQSVYAPPSLGAGQWSTGTEYDLDHQPIRATLPESAQVDIDYDSAGRLSLVQIPDAAIRYAYDGVTGKIDSILSRDSIFTAYEFDGSLFKKETWSGPIGGSVAFKYNADFRVDSVRVNGSSIPYHYDQDGMLTQAAGLNLVYDLKNTLLRKATLNALKDTLDYNGFGELIHQTAVNGDSALYNATYQRDKLGRVTEKLETIGGVTSRYSYEYDILGRLKTVLVDSVLFSRYQYDANGNRTARVVPGDSLVGAYDAQDRLTQYGALSYLYTPNGELAATVWGGDTTHYSYDALGNLLSVQMPGGPLIEYLIDGKNRRVGKKVNGTLVQGFLYQNQLNPVAELNGSGAVVARFVYASKGNVPDLMIKGGVTYRIISDPLGSPRLVLKASNDSVVQRMNYDEFGNMLLNSNPGFQPFGFAGGIYDGHTSLVRFGARDYDSWSGRWTAKDPIGFARDGLNIYAYVANDPINNVDPLGKNRTYLQSLDLGGHATIIVDVWNESGTEIVGQESLNFSAFNGITTPYSIMDWSQAATDMLDPRFTISFDVKSGADADRYLLNQWKAWVEYPRYWYTGVTNCVTESLDNIDLGIKK